MTKLRLTQGNCSSYKIGPVLSDVSLSLASALRRVLLSSLPGAAITSVRIEGVQHEFQDIACVKEDVPDIVQNLKKVRLRSFSDRAVTVHLDTQGERLVTAGDIKIPGTIEIVNPEAHLATLDNENAHLSMTMTIGVGRGFVAFDAQVTEPQPIGVIPIDAIYSPIVHVNFTIEPVRDTPDALDTILLEITTDGTISPDEALRQSADILRQQFAVVASGEYERDSSHKPSHSSNVLIPEAIYAMPLSHLALSTRAYNALHRNGIRNVGTLLEMGERDILMLHNMGPRTLQELCDSLKAHNLLPKGAESD